MEEITEIKIIPITKFLLPSLTNSERKAAKFLLQNPDKVANMSLVDFAELSGSSQASIIRLCRKMETDGYSQMKALLLSQLDDYIQPPVQKKEFVPGMNMTQILKRVFSLNIQILKDTFALASDEYEKAFEAILNAKQICFFAIGDATIPCQFAYIKFRKLGYTCYMDMDADMQLINASNLKEGDVAIAVSHSGNSRQIVNAMKIAKERGATTICITKLSKSEMIKWCDIKLFTTASVAVLEKEIIARRVAEQAIIESLYFAVLEKTEPESGQTLKANMDAMLGNKL